MKSAPSTPWAHWYTGSKWRAARRRFLFANPLCVMCEREGRTTLAEVVDHRVPHKGCARLFWDRANWQGLCKRHHDSDKRRMELGTARPRIGVDGWPVQDEPDPAPEPPRLSVY